MARQKKNEQLEPTKNTQEEIEAALARACGQTPTPSQPIPQPTINDKVFRADEVDEVFKPDDVLSKNEINAPKIKSEHGIKSSEIKFPELKASECFKVSSENKDKSIYNYIMAINDKIEKECGNGGYSTNVTLRVIPSQWVNVQHIVDWYRANGFDVIVDEIKQPQYGMNAGSMEYNINISWVHPNT